MIPKTLHIIWVGDESKRPDNCIATWRAHNPDWELKIWGNAELMSYGWYNADHIRAMSGRELNGVADIMRWEILFREGGFVVDADSICRRPLEPWLFDCEACACWENEIIRPGLIAAGYVASEAQNPFFRQLILDLKEKPTVIDRMAWQSVGPLYLTEAHRKYNYVNLTVWPSHFFIPQHYSGIRYSGKGPVFADQEWGSTRRNYDELHTRSVA